MSVDAASSGESIKAEEESLVQVMPLCLLAFRRRTGCAIRLPLATALLGLPQHAWSIGRWLKSTIGIALSGYPVIRVTS